MLICFILSVIVHCPPSLSCLPSATDWQATLDIIVKTLLLWQSQCPESAGFSLQRMKTKLALCKSLDQDTFLNILFLDIKSQTAAE